MSTTSKEECITLINNFLQTRSFIYARNLFLCYLEGQDDTTINAALQLLNQNPEILNVVIPKVLIELETRYSLIELSKNNNPILVY